MNSVIRSAVEERHDAVTNVLVNVAMMLPNQWSHQTEVGVDEPEVLIRCHTLRECGEGSDVREQDAHLLLHLISKLHIEYTHFFKTADQLTGNKALVSFRQSHLLLQCYFLQLVHSLGHGKPESDEHGKKQDPTNCDQK